MARRRKPKNPHLERGERETWVVGYEGRYTVTTEGRVFTYVLRGRTAADASARMRDEPVELQYGTDTHQYRTVGLSDGTRAKTKRVRRLVAEAFFEGCVEGSGKVFYKDGDNQNDALANLVYIPPPPNGHNGKSKSKKRARSRSRTKTRT